MTYGKAAGAACEYSKSWSRTVWFCLLANGDHVVGTNLENIKVFGAQFGDVRVLGKADGGTLRKIKENRPSLRSFISSKDSDVVYHITQDLGGALSCSCPGFKFRGQCKHMAQYQTERTPS